MLTLFHSRIVTRAAAAACVALGLTLSPLAIATPAQAESNPAAITIDGGPTSATEGTPVTIEADIYLPEQTPAPAVVLAHGFGGSKTSVAEDAQFMVDQGFVVVAYSARGFGASTGSISLNAPDYEVADASRIIDYLAESDAVIQDSPGDPRVGFAGGSYGGALSLMVAGYDPRVDAIAADITWNNLQTSLFPQSAVNSTELGVYKQLWAALFFSSGLTGGPIDGCGRFTEQWCQAYNLAATTGTITDEGAALMAASSPQSITDRITVPTMLGGGQSDSLFPLNQLNANAQQIAEANPDTPLKVLWHAAGHDGGVSETERLRELTAEWFTAHLLDGPAVANDFSISVVEGSAISDRALGTVSVVTAPTYPGIGGDESTEIALLGPPQQILAPAGGVPSAITALPGAGGLAARFGAALSLPVPQQSAGFISMPINEAGRIIGSPTATLTVSSTEPVTDVTLFAGVRIVSGTDRQTLPNGLVAPIRLDRVGPEPIEITIELPTIVTEWAAGDRLALTVSTTDQGFAMPPGPAVYSIGLAAPSLTIPNVATTAASGGVATWWWLLGALLIVIALAVVVRLVRPRPAKPAVDDQLLQTPVAVVDLVQEFSGGLRAVDGVDFTVPPGIVLGLLGPNGAGKTTTMRMVMGLLRPTQGAVFVFGQRVSAGASVLSRVGSFVEGPGFLPHLSGKANLDIYWRASGRVGDPHLDEVLDIAGLGDAVDRKVRTYSQGMRQRLGIAQAMLGLPDLLMLDEPTNGLDPPQIRHMRQVVQDYAATGKTVIISSHLLSEVEQTCSHVVVMNHGRVISQGTVESLLAGRSGRRLEDVFLELVGEGHTV
ncbi:MAG: alpha/beta fold hydrolase [Candidatus Nanopelagicales bacterium]